MNDSATHTNNKISFLVIGYSAPETLSKTLKHFSSNECIFFLHLDLKIDATQYLERIENKSNLRLVEERFNIYWGGFSMIKATIALVNAATKLSDASTFVLISDDSFPLYSESVIVSSLSTCPNRIYMHSVGEDKPYVRYENFYYPDSNFSSLRELPAQTRAFNIHNIDAVDRLKSLITRGKYAPLKLHHGSQWWSLTREVANYCLNRLDSDLWLLESFEFSLIPDEMVFQTLAAEILKNKSNNYLYTDGMMFVDFSKLHKPDRYYSKNDFPDQIKSNKLFIRKYLPL